MWLQIPGLVTLGSKLLYEGKVWLLRVGNEGTVEAI